MSYINKRKKMNVIRGLYFKTFTTVKNNVTLLESGAVTVRYFHPSLIFVFKAREYP
jgi:hypothetical protein